MKTIVQLMMLACLVMFVAAPSHADEDGEAWHVYNCQILDDTGEDQIIELAEKWVDAAKKTKGVEGFEVWVFFPVAAEMGESDFRMLLRAPSFAAWGALWDIYDETAAADVEDSWSQMFDCPDSWLFEGFKIEGIETEP